jgi:LacI family transcriptional regulator
MKQKSPRAQQGNTTITDVACESGFSPMTVSRVINGEKNVKDSTREAVMAGLFAKPGCKNIGWCRSDTDCHAV